MKNLIGVLAGINIPLLFGLIVDKQTSKNWAYRLIFPGFLFISNIVVLYMLIPINPNTPIKDVFGTVGLDVFLLIFMVSIVSFVITTLKYRYVGDRTIDNAYLNFSKDVAEDEEIKIFAGNLSFLGEIINHSKCLANGNYKDLMLGTDGYKICKIRCKQANNMKCILKSKQFIQLMELHTKRVKLDILCRKSRGIQLSALLGKLIHTFESDVTIRFYDEDIHKSIYILARIKNERLGKAMLWHWKYDSTKYSMPQEYRKSDRPHDKDAVGDTVFYLIDKLLWKQSKPINRTMRDKLSNAFFNAIK